MKEVSIPQSVREIGSFAFRGCKGLADNEGFVVIRDILYDYSGNDRIAKIPENVVRIEEESFYNHFSTKRFWWNHPGLYQDNSALLETKAILGAFNFREFNRQVNHIVYLLDKLTVYERIGKDDLSVRIFLPKFSLPQIMDFIQIASENKAANVLPMLMEYKNDHFADFDPMDEFTLDLI